MEQWQGPGNRWLISSKWRKQFCTHNNPPQGGHTPTGDYKRAVEEHVATTCRFGGTLAYGSTFMEDILAAPAPGPTILQASLGMDAAARRLYNVLYLD